MQVAEHFCDKGCVITGAASGIGLAVGEALLAAGAAVFMADVDAAALETAAHRLAAAHPGRVQAMPVDVTKADDVRRMVEGAAARHGRLDVLFNNAGIGATQPIETVTLDHWRRIVDINLWGVVHGIHFALPIMRRQGGGHIVNTASMAGLMPFPFQALYCATKFAVAGLSESLRFELADEGIHVSVVCPGHVASAIFGKPLAGGLVDLPLPPDAIPADEAAATILAGVAARAGIIALPEGSRTLWRRYWSDPEKSETWMLDLARQRREAIRTKGTYY
ncbi:short-chain dehydrogenase [Rhodoplanes elegans]|uniref:Short-chain dehydrogenase n=1 Tax=Rhodoplanes elegans TaxID=29408 RepID=A0A327K9T4_9BRAD|nr:SDR family oxidoreductase [Rhodoplanes elegans]MBK5959172.1 short-chain dehydrogenase [Rhodoplanes elegans]RAI34794.1 short-chain dehydrogenase [Rhodoplanes elegans]